jgi:hypothetical protein
MLADDTHRTLMHGRFTISVLTDIHNDVTKMFLVPGLLGYFIHFCFFSKFGCVAVVLTLDMEYMYVISYIHAHSNLLNMVW